jgi:hypothetical protein
MAAHTEFTAPDYTGWIAGFLILLAIIGGAAALWIRYHG